MACTHPFIVPIEDEDGNVVAVQCGACGMTSRAGVSARRSLWEWIRKGRK